MRTTLDLVQIFDQLSCCCLNEFFHFFNSLFLPRTACRRDTPWTFPTRTKLAENLWNTFGRLHATWISVEPRSLLVTRHDPSTFRKIGSKNAICTNFWNCSKSLKKLDFSTFQVFTTSTVPGTSLAINSTVLGLGKGWALFKIPKVTIRARN